jgi:large conductance mechanosensitive channel
MVAGFQQGVLMLQEFKAFILRGNVMDLAVAVIIGAAFGKIVTSFTDELVMPIIGLVSGGVDFSSLFVALGPIPADYTGAMTDYAALKAAGVPLLGYGAFITAMINFVIIAFVIFMMVRSINKMMTKPEEAPAAPAGPSAEEALLMEIRDELRARKL